MKFQEQECPKSTLPFSSKMLNSSVKMIPNTMHIMKGFFVTVKSPKLKIDPTQRRYSRNYQCVFALIKCLFQFYLTERVANRKVHKYRHCNAHPSK